MEITGKLVQKLERETGVSKSGKTWEKQSILIEQAGADYNKEIAISFFGDKIKKLRDIEIGSDVSVSINLSSREYNGKYYHNIDGWFIAKFGEETVSPLNDETLPF
jgi:histidinol phosphatase-like enzyme